MVKRPLEDLYHQTKKEWNQLNSNGWATPMSFRQRQAPGEDLTLKPPPKDPFKRSYDEIFSIQQTGNQGYRIIDITPSSIGNGSQARGTIFGSGWSMTFASVDVSSGANNIVVQFVGGGIAGSETCVVSYPDAGDGGAQITLITVTIQSGVSTIGNIQNLITLSPTASALIAVTSSAGVNATSGSSVQLSGGFDPDFACSIPNSVIYELLGSPSSGAASAALGSAFYSIRWKTIPLTLNANFLKIEHLPVRTNGATPVAANKNVYGTYTSNGSIQGQFSAAANYQNIFLVQFDNTNSNPIIAKPGDVFKIPFNTVYITLMGGVPSVTDTSNFTRVRVTAGYNSQIISADDNHTVSNPAFYGFGINSPKLHYTPFSICSRDLGLAGNVPTIPTNAGSPTYTKELIVNDNTNGVGDGGVYGWITSISYTARMGIGASTDALCDFELGIGNLVPITGFTTQLRRLYYCSGILNNTIGGEPVIVYSHQASFDHPIRFSLKKMECLILRLRSNATSVDHMFSIQGYCMSNLSPYTAPVFVPTYTQAIPYYPAWVTTENPYPLD